MIDEVSALEELEKRRMYGKSNHPQGTAGSEQQQKEYIIDGEYIDKLDEWLSEHDIDELQRMQIRTRLKFTPHTIAPSPHRGESDTVKRTDQFIIYGGELIDLVDSICFEKGLRILKRVKTRPHTSAPAPSTVVEDITFEGAAIVQAAKREAAKAAREQVLLLLIERIEGKKIEKWGEFERESIFRSIESLRHQQEAEQPKEEWR